MDEKNLLNVTYHTIKLHNCQHTILGGLTKKYGMQAVCISGSIIGFFGLLIAPYSSNIQHLMLTIGVIAGAGAGAITLPANIAVGYYFEKKR